MTERIDVDAVFAAEWTLAADPPAAEDMSTEGGHRSSETRSEDPI